MVGITPVKQTYCYLDRKPINKSKAYRMVIKLLGKKTANKLTYKDY